jgi:hypothetical protein
MIENSTSIVEVLLPVFYLRTYDYFSVLLWSFNEIVFLFKES